MPSSEVKSNTFIHVDSRELLARYLDDLCVAAHKMCKKVGSHGHTGESIMSLMLKTTGRPDGFLLINVDDEGAFKGFIYAVLIPTASPWVDFVGMWTVPGVATRVKFEAFEILKEWARAKGARSILAGLTRSPLNFFKFFHEPMGFKNIGIIIEYDLNEKEKENGSPS